MVRGHDVGIAHTGAVRGLPLEPAPRRLPHLNPKVWAIAFLIFAVILTVVFAVTMREFLRRADNLPGN